VPKPAAKLGDDHVCTGPDHIGGPIVGPAEPTVLIANLPAARFSDMASCVGVIFMDAIALGAPTVIVGKLPAAGRGDPTKHGGTVTSGTDSVLLGDPPPWITVLRRGNMLVIVDRNTHTIRIVGVQEFKGDGASDEYVQKATDCINETWSGPTTFEGEAYNVDCMVTGRKTGDPPDPMANQIEVKQTSDPPAVTSRKDRSFTSGFSKTSGYQHSTDTDGGMVTPAHEFGHSMGLDDEYKEGLASKVGLTDRTITHTGPDGGIMGYVEPGSRPTPDNFNDLINGK
jgi:uncharacterized Zn-binding protein involved in type VI secretion